MNKSDRLELMKSIFNRVGHIASPGLIVVSDRQVAQIAKEEFNFQTQSLISEDENVIDMEVGSGIVGDYEEY